MNSLLLWATIMVVVVLVNIGALLLVKNGNDDYEGDE